MTVRKWSQTSVLAVIDANQELMFLDQTQPVASDRIKRAPMSALNTKILSTILAGLAITNATVTAADSILSGIGKLQGQISNLTTTQVTEGSNLYFTEARTRASVLTGLSLVNSAITAADSVLTAFGKTQGQFNNLTTTQVAEGSNLYFTETRVRSTVLTGLSITNSPVTAADSILSGIGKLQGQINAIGGGNFWSVVDTNYLRPLTGNGYIGIKLYNAAETQKVAFSYEADGIHYNSTDPASLHIFDQAISGEEGITTTSSSSWFSSAFSGVGGTDRVVIGNLSGIATIAGNNFNSTAYAHLNIDGPGKLLNINFLAMQVNGALEISGVSSYLLVTAPLGVNITSVLDVGGTLDVIGAATLSSTLAVSEGVFGTSSTVWRGGVFSGSGGTDNVSIGNLVGFPTIGGNNSTFSAWTNMYIYPASAANLGIGLDFPGGQTANAQLHSAKSTILGVLDHIADASIYPSQVNMWLDEGSNLLNFTVKYSGGTVKNGAIGLI